MSEEKRTIKATTREGLVSWLDGLSQRLPLIAPMAVGEQILYRPVSDSAEIVLDFGRTDLSAKEYFFPGLWADRFACQRVLFSGHPSPVCRREGRGWRQATRALHRRGARHLWRTALRRQGVARSRRAHVGGRACGPLLCRAPRRHDPDRPGVPRDGPRMLLHQPGRVA